MKRWLQSFGKRLKDGVIGPKTLGFFVILLGVSAVGYATYYRSRSNSNSVTPSSNPNSYAGEPVPLNLTPEIGVGFRGDVHPLLNGRTNLELTAHWIADRENPKTSKKFSVEEYHFTLNMIPARERQTYTERDFSAFLPETLTTVGQIWSLDLDKVAALLRQLHPSPSMHLNGEGRRVGPDGAFAVLRAMSPSYLDIAFRVHAEFDISADLPKELRMQGWYAPAFFAGQMVVNREKGTVEYFDLALPTDRSLNVELTLKPIDYTPPPPGCTKSLSHYMARVDRMDLQGGNGDLVAKAGG